MKAFFFVLDLQRYTPNVLCDILSNKVTEQKDNHGMVAPAVYLQMQPRTKHIAIKYHHIRSFVIKFDVVIKHIVTKE